MKQETIGLDHGSGGRVAHRLMTDMLLPILGNPILSRLDDGAMVDIGGKRLAFSTDTFVVDPIFFPGGCIGDLAVNGTVNDVAMCGAVPVFLSLGLVIEEGFPLSDLENILIQTAAAAKHAGVQIVTGDTKVVPKGSVDKLFVNTTGLGWIPDYSDVGSHKAEAGDKIILSGTMADHGMAILTQRESLALESGIVSDTAALNHMVNKLLSECKTGVHVLRDPTRGGVGTALNEIAERSNVGILIREADIPINDQTAGVCELLGFDPLYVANEGKLLAFVRPDDAGRALESIRSDPLGAQAEIIGEVVSEEPGTVVIETRIGGRRIVDMLTGSQLPRIC